MRHVLVLFASYWCLPTRVPPTRRRRRVTVSLFGDYFPNRQDTTELRSRVFVEEKVEPSPRLRLTVSGFVEGLLSRRPVPGTDVRVAVGQRRHRAGAGRQRRDPRPACRLSSRDTHESCGGSSTRYSRPTSINPLDVSRFFFEGRSEARLPMLLARARVHIAESVTLEGVYLPDFRRGRFDQLDEPTSPFNLPVSVVARPRGVPGHWLSDHRRFPCPIERRRSRRPTRRVARASRATSGRVDWSVSAFRGFETFGLYHTRGRAGPSSGRRRPS